MNKATSVSNEPLVTVPNDGITTSIEYDPERIRMHSLTNKIISADQAVEWIKTGMTIGISGFTRAGDIKVIPAALARKCVQSGIGCVANAVLQGLAVSRFDQLEMYSEVLQDAVFDLIDAGKIRHASACSMTLSPDKLEKTLHQFDNYKPYLTLRPQELSNHPELIRRLGVIAMNTAIEIDIYGHVNSTHVMGTQMMNGIGGSGDFARNAALSVFVTPSTAKNGRISCIVPMVTHVDHTEHDVDLVITEFGVADLRGLSPRERAPKIIGKCAHPDYREELMAYFMEASSAQGHTPHILSRSFSMHERFLQTGTMKKASCSDGKSN